MKRFLRFLLGILLLPLAWAVTRAVILLVLETATRTSITNLPAIMLGTGFLLWALIYSLLPPPTKAYIWGHELTHALWGLLFGARIHNIRVNGGSGSVTLSKSNMLITLAPYFFPFYTFVVLLLRLIAHWVFPQYPLQPMWMFLIGFTWSFHCCFTINSLLIRQPDIQEHGRVFSWVFIYLLNLLVLAAGVLLLMPGVQFMWFCETLLQLTVGSYLAVFATLAAGANKLWTWSGLRL